MKKTYLFGMFAAFALASCSSESEPAANNGNGNANEGEAQYLAVNICSPASATRADNFEAGSEGENYAEKATFVLLNGSNTVTQVIKDQSLLPWGSLAEDDNNVARISSAVLVIPTGTNKAPSEEPSDTKILAILNAPAGLEIANGQSLSTVLANVGDYVTAASTTDNAFIMTNSTYKSGTEVVTATPITKFEKTAELAKANPVEIYVERVAAKVRTNAMSGDGFSNNGATITIDGKEKALTIDIQGIEIANIANKSYLFKNLSGINNPFTGWNDDNNCRSYWAVNPSGDNAPGYRNQSYTAIGTTSVLSGQSFYIQENADGQTAQTAVLVTAQLMDGNSPFEFVSIAGEYYTPEGGKTQLANMFSSSSNFYLKEADNKYVTIPQDYYKWVSKKDDATRIDGEGVEGWEAYLVLDTEKISGKEFAKSTNGKDFTPAETTEITTALQGKAYRALYWTQGMAYYFVNIKNAADKEGVVRNHIYDLNIQSIEGVGVPVFNEKEIIIPDEPSTEKLFYLAARINILEWKIVKQNVNFNHEY